MADRSVSRSFRKVQIPAGINLPKSLDAAIADGWEIVATNSQFCEWFDEAGEIHLQKQLGELELRCAVPYAVQFHFDPPQRLEAFALVAESGLSLFRVTAWSPETGHEYVIGLFIALDRNHAIRKAQSPAYAQLVLDAAEVAFTGNL